MTENPCPSAPETARPRDGLVLVATTWQVQVPAPALGPDMWQFRYETASRREAHEVAARIGPDCRVLVLNTYIEINIEGRSPDREG